MSPRQTTPMQDLMRGVWKENPVLIQMLGLCPALAVTNTVENAIAMSAATAFVLLGSSLLISLLKRNIPKEVRISAFILIIATFVTMVDYTLNALVPLIHKELGAFIALIVCNCMILARQEAFASKQPVGRSLLDAAGTSAGFAIALLMMGVFREVLGNGSILGVNIMGPHFEPWIIMILPPGAFFAIGFILLGYGWWQDRRKGPPRRPREWPHGVRTPTPRTGRRERQVA
jgi:Na+-translocating ferredoxin:NAD+ oxidoreductase subunit E